MEMIVASDSTAVMAIITAANTGNATLSRLVSGSAGRRPPASRPNPTKIATGMRIVPSAPSGSRMKILISSQVSCSRPRNINSIADRVAGDREKDVLERRQQRAEVGRPNPVLGQALDDVGHEILAAAADDVALIAPLDRVDRRDSPKVSLRVRVGRTHFYRSLRAVRRDQPRRRVDVDDAAVIDDRDAVAQALGLLHQVRRQEDGLA